MGAYGESGSTFRKLVKWLIVGIAAIVAFRLALVALALVVRFGMTALFTLLPILVVGWVILKLLRYFTRDPNSVAT